MVEAGGRLKKTQKIQGTKKGKHESKRVEKTGAKKIQDLKLRGKEGIKKKTKSRKRWKLVEREDRETKTYEKKGIRKNRGNKRIKTQRKEDAYKENKRYKRVGERRVNKPKHKEKGYEENHKKQRVGERKSQ